MANAKKTAQGTWRIQIEIEGVRKSGTFASRDAAQKWAENQSKKIRQAKALRIEAAEMALATAVPKRMLDAISRVPYERHEVVAAAIPAPSFIGIYFLIKDAEVEYVGQSVDILHRISRHRREGKDFDSFAYFLCEREKLDEMEALYITAFMPWMNFTLGKVQRPPNFVYKR